MTEKPKFCVDCKHHKMGAAVGRCMHPDLPRIGHAFYVTGDPKDEIADHNFCEIMRRADGSCGLEGKLWEPKPVPVCPCCRMPHPADVACKPGELRDNGPQTFSRDADPWRW